MKRLELGPASWAALEGFAEDNRVDGEQPLDAYEWMAVLASMTLQVLALADGEQDVYLECIALIREAAFRSGTRLMAVDPATGRITPQG